MDKALSLFRVFDLAFFAPGLILYWVLHKNRYLEVIDPLDGCRELSTVGGLVSLVATIGMIYILGVTVHGIQAAIQWVNEYSTEPHDPTSWYQRLGAGSRADLAIYFWYMRATCWNLCIAGIAIIVIFAIKGPWYAALVPVIPVLLLLKLGFDYDKALHKAAQDPAE